MILSWSLNASSLLQRAFVLGVKAKLTTEAYKFMVKDANPSLTAQSICTKPYSDHTLPLRCQTW